MKTQIENIKEAARTNPVLRMSAKKSDETLTIAPSIIRKKFVNSQYGDEIVKIEKKEQNISKIERLIKATKIQGYDVSILVGSEIFEV